MLEKGQPTQNLVVMDERHPPPRFHLKNGLFIAVFIGDYLTEYLGGKCPGWSSCGKDEADTWDCDADTCWLTPPVL